MLSVEEIKALPDGTRVVDDYGLTYAKNADGLITLSSQLQLTWSQIGLFNFRLVK